MIPRALPARFFARPASEVARDLLGCLLVSTVGEERAIGRIVETEAYVGPDDPASHAWVRHGRTLRNATMFDRPGLAYVYRSYGVHWCLNAVTDTRDFPAAVLIRAIEPVEGTDVMRRRRSATRALAPPRDTALGSGPGRLCAALGITGEHDGHTLSRPPLVIAHGDAVADADVAIGPRIGISRAVDWPLRFHVRGSKHVSG